MVKRRGERCGASCPYGTAAVANNTEAGGSAQCLRATTAYKPGAVTHTGYCVSQRSSAPGKGLGGEGGKLSNAEEFALRYGLQTLLKEGVFKLLERWSVLPRKAGIVFGI